MALLAICVAKQTGGRRKAIFRCFTFDFRNNPHTIFVRFNNRFDCFIIQLKRKIAGTAKPAISANFNIYVTTAVANQFADVHFSFTTTQITIQEQADIGIGNFSRFACGIHRRIALCFFYRHIMFTDTASAKFHRVFDDIGRIISYGANRFVDGFIAVGDDGFFCRDQYQIGNALSRGIQFCFSGRNCIFRGIVNPRQYQPVCCFSGIKCIRAFCTGDRFIQCGLRNAGRCYFGAILIELVNARKSL